MRIGFNTLYENPFRPTGSHEQNRQLVTWLSRLGREHTLVLFISRANASAFDMDGPIERVGCFTSNEHRVRRVLVEQTVLPLHLATGRCDVLVAPGNTCPIWAPCPVVLHIKTMQHTARPEAMGLARRAFRSAMIASSARRATAIIANTDDNRDQIVRAIGVAPEKVHVVPEGLDHEHFRPPADRDRLLADLAREGLRPPFVLFVSGLWPYKRVEVLIEAFGRMRSRGLPHRLLIVGDGMESYRRRLVAIARDRTPAQSVSFLGARSKAEVARLMQAADVVALPSVYESFGRVLTEAMACGTPVVAARASCLPEVVEDAGLLFPPDDPEALAGALEAIVTDPGLRGRLVESGLERAAGYSWERTARETLAIVEAAAGLTRGASEPMEVEH
ncbi:MAG TPA: glycosyltransferase family 1 protein [Candidatus Dormibacteraeota bacterium]